MKNLVNYNQQQQQQQYNIKTLNTASPPLHEQTHTIMKRALGIIPARYGSTRFPGKLISDLGGLPVIVRTVNAAKQSQQLSNVWLATDDKRISQLVEKQCCKSIEIIHTSSDCPSGSDRLVAALNIKGIVPEPMEHSDLIKNKNKRTEETFPYDVIVNVQGDEPLLNPKHIDLVIDCLYNNPKADIATLVVPLDPTTEDGQFNITNPNVVKCVLDQNNNALYFSRSIIPYYNTSNSTKSSKDDGASANIDTSGKTRYLKHIGLYAYRPSSLFKFVRSKSSQLEIAEGLEQLRAMSLGMSIKVVQVNDAKGGIDTIEQLEHARALLKEEKRRSVLRRV